MPVKYELSFLIFIVHVTLYIRKWEMRQTENENRKWVFYQIRKMERHMQTYLPVWPRWVCKNVLA